MDSADIHHAKQLKANWDAAQEAADSEKRKFLDFIGALHARRTHGDMRRLAEAFERTPKQIERWARGETSGRTVHRPQ